MEFDTWLIYDDKQMQIKNKTIYLPDVENMQIRLGKHLGWNDVAGEPIFEWADGKTQSLPLYLHIVRIVSTEDGITSSVFQDG